jgi:DNA-directed RNA polymerase subunit F
LNSELLNNIKNDPKKVSIKHNAKYFIDKFNNLNDKIDNDNFTENDKSEFLVLKSEYESKYASKFTDKENEEITDLIDEIENKLDKSYESNVSKIISIVKPKNKSGLVKRIILAAAVIGGFVLAAKGCGKQNTTDVSYTVEDGNNGSIDSTSADDVSINETTDALDSKVDAIIDGIIDGTTESEEPIVSSSDDYFVDGSTDATTDSDLDNKQDDLNSIIDNIINDNTVADNSNDDYTVDNAVDNSADNTVDNDVDNTISGDYTTDDNNYYIGDVVNINDGSYIYDDEYDAAFDNERQNPYFTNEADRIVCGVQLQMPDGKVVNITDREDGYNAKIDYYLSQGGVVSSVLVRNSEVNADGYEGFYNIDSVSKKTMGGMSR